MLETEVQAPGVPLTKLIQELSHLRWLAQPFFILIGPLGLHPGSQACTHLHSFVVDLPTFSHQVVHHCPIAHFFLPPSLDSFTASLTNSLTDSLTD